MKEQWEKLPHKTVKDNKLKLTDASTTAAPNG